MKGKNRGIATRGAKQRCGSFLYKTALALAVLCPLADFAGAGGSLEVSFDRTNGGVASIVLSSDTNRMNWAQGTGTWGTIRAYSGAVDTSDWADLHRNPPLMKLDALTTTDSSAVARYSAGVLKATVTREVRDGALHETYAFTNEGYAPRYFLRGHLGILATFNDSYDSAETCMRERCHAHVHARGTNAFVHAVRMSPGTDDVVLEMTEGALDGYSVRRIRREYSNDRGDIVLHPAPFVLRQGETRRFSWTVSARRPGSFRPPVRVRRETCFPGETFEVEDAAGVHRVPAERPGELEAFGARLYVSAPFGTLVDAAVRHIVGRQQCRDERSPLDGAFVIWDDEEKRQYFDDAFGDHNACRERIFMGILLARWLQTHGDEKVRESLDRFVRFVFREFVDLKTGAVYNSLGHDPSYVRLYNAPWAALLMCELYRLDPQPRYLDAMERTMLGYYAGGGKKFYATADVAADVIPLVERAGRDGTALREAYREHVYNILSYGTRYPAHEVRYEQATVAFAAMMLARYLLTVEDDPKVRAGLDLQLAMLRRFDGDQPDHLSGGIAIRHWDDYWFGKSRLYGDTLQYWCVLSGCVYALASEVTGERAWRDRADRCFRNLLCLYRSDGFGSAARLLPLSVTLLEPDGTETGPAERGERFDAWSNDQYAALYYMLRYANFGKD